MFRTKPCDSETKGRSHRRTSKESFGTQHKRSTRSLPDTDAFGKRLSKSLALDHPEGATPTSKSKFSPEKIKRLYSGLWALRNSMDRHGSHLEDDRFSIKSENITNTCARIEPVSRYAQSYVGRSSETVATASPVLIGRAQQRREKTGVYTSKRSLENVKPKQKEHESRSPRLSILSNVKMPAKSLGEPIFSKTQRPPGSSENIHPATNHDIVVPRQHVTPTKREPIAVDVDPSQKSFGWHGLDYHLQKNTTKKQSKDALNTDSSNPEATERNNADQSKSLSKEADHDYTDISKVNISSHENHCPPNDERGTQNIGESDIQQGNVHRGNIPGSPAQETAVWSPVVHPKSKQLSSSKSVNNRKRSSPMRKSLGGLFGECLSNAPHEHEDALSDMTELQRSSLNPHRDVVHPTIHIQPGIISNSVHTLEGMSSQISPSTLAAPTHPVGSPMMENWVQDPFNDEVINGVNVHDKQADMAQYQSPKIGERHVQQNNYSPIVISPSRPTIPPLTDDTNKQFHSFNSGNRLNSSDSKYSVVHNKEILTGLDRSPHVEKIPVNKGGASNDATSGHAYIYQEYNPTQNTPMHAEITAISTEAKGKRTKYTSRSAELSQLLPPKSRQDLTSSQYVPRLGNTGQSCHNGAFNVEYSHPSWSETAEQQQYASPIGLSSVIQKFPSYPYSQGSSIKQFETSMSLPLYQGRACVDANMFPHHQRPTSLSIAKPITRHMSGDRKPSIIVGKAHMIPKPESPVYAKPNPKPKPSHLSSHHEKDEHKHIRHLVDEWEQRNDAAEIHASDITSYDTKCVDGSTCSNQPAVSFGSPEYRVVSHVQINIIMLSNCIS